jgi:hypothetical protein
MEKMLVGKQNYSKIFNKRKEKKIKNVFWPIEPKKFFNKKFKFNGKIFDFGCGIKSWVYNKTIRDHGTYFGFDTDNNTIKWLKKEGKFKDFWKTSEEFDLIIASQVFEHLNLEERENFLKKSFKLLKVNGMLLIDFPFTRNLGLMDYWMDRTHNIPPAIEDEALLLEEIGFKKVKIYGVGLSFWPPYYFFRIVLNLLCGFRPFHTVIITAVK